MWRGWGRVAVDDAADPAADDRHDVVGGVVGPADVSSDVGSAGVDPDVEQDEFGGADLHGGADPAGAAGGDDGGF
ncbi:MAG: hypothetical protein ACR2FF_04060 [Mycobacteriales bacterium]